MKRRNGIERDRLLLPFVDCSRVPAMVACPAYCSKPDSPHRLIFWSVSVKFSTIPIYCLLSRQTEQLGPSGSSLCGPASFGSCRPGPHPHRAGPPKLLSDRSLRWWLLDATFPCSSLRLFCVAWCILSRWDSVMAWARGLGTNIFFKRLFKWNVKVLAYVFTFLSVMENGAIKWGKLWYPKYNMVSFIQKCYTWPTPLPIISSVLVSIYNKINFISFTTL